jgi:hypothetical protein
MISLQTCIKAAFSTSQSSNSIAKKYIPPFLSSSTQKIKEKYSGIYHSSV